MTAPPPSILIVEDSETQAMQLRYLLEEEGWEVVRSSTAEEALDELSRRVPSLMIADYHLPGIQGDELCRRVRMNADTRGLPILMLTVDERGEREPAGLDSGADDYVSKSVAADILLLRVRTLLRTSAARSTALGPQDSYFHKARLLAIDDSPTYLEQLTETLIAEGYDVTCATSGRAGLAQFSQSAFDCVVVDLVMPEIDGIEVCRKINESGVAAKNSVVVIMLTACETKEDMTRGLEAGADDFVGKSGDMTVLKARIRALLRRKFFQEENRRIREELLRKEMETREARAAHELAAAKAVSVEELQRKNQELEAFSYSVSHDLRAPLRSIDGFSNALLEDYAGQLDATGQDYLRRVRAAAQRMGDLIDDLLQLSRMGRAALQPGRVDLSALARTVSDEIRRANSGREVEVRIKDGILARADRQLMLVVLENLLGNAWKFTRKTASAVIEFGVAEQGGIASYYVRDNGAGFEMKFVGKLFAPFQRLHTEASFPGTGIGLATVHRIIDRHGGRVWAEGATGKGATFYWTLPAAQHQEGDNDSKQPDHPVG